MSDTTNEPADDAAPAPVQAPPRRGGPGGMRGGPMMGLGMPAEKSMDFRGSGLLRR